MDIKTFIMNLPDKELVEILSKDEKGMYDLEYQIKMVLKYYDASFDETTNFIVNGKNGVLIECNTSVINDIFGNPYGIEILFQPTKNCSVFDDDFCNAYKISLYIGIETLFNIDRLEKTKDGLYIISMNNEYDTTEIDAMVIFYDNERLQIMENIISEDVDKEVSIHLERGEKFRKSLLKTNALKELYSLPKRGLEGISFKKDRLENLHGYDFSSLGNPTWWKGIHFVKAKRITAWSPRPTSHYTSLIYNINNIGKPRFENEESFPYYILGENEPIAQTVVSYATRYLDEIFCNPNEQVIEKTRSKKIGGMSNE